MDDEASSQPKMHILHCLSWEMENFCRSSHINDKIMFYEENV